jgi:hypothetical protein
MLYRCTAVLSVLWFFTAAGRSDEPIIHSVQVLGTGRAVTLRTRTGSPLDQTVLDKDVRALWATGSFDDIRVEASATSQGTDVVFRVVEKPRLYLNKVQYDPPKAQHTVKIPAGTPMDLERAQLAASTDERQLIAEGYRDAKVEADLVPAGVRTVDLRLHEDAGPRYVVGDVVFSGDPVLPPRELKDMLRAMHVRRIIPLLWTRRPPFSDDAIGSDVERLRSLYMSHGYLEPRIQLDEVKYDGHKAFVNFRVRAGERYRVREAQVVADGRTIQIPAAPNGDFPAAGLCRCLFEERHRAEAAGKMDFNTQLRLTGASAPDGPVVPAGDWVNLNATVDTGKSYTVGRIDILGSKMYSDLTVRRTLVLNEGAVFDWSRLRRSIARVNGMGLFEPLGETSVHIQRHEALQTADITFHLKDKPRGRWSFSGPMGPVSVGGPLQAQIETRLPPWGRGLLEASTYFLSLSYVGFASPVLNFLPAGANKRFFYLIALQRPFLPGQAWLSGFTVSPQLGWQGFLLSYGTRHLYAGARGALAGGFGEPPLAVPVERIGFGKESSSGDYFLCEPPRSRWVVPRTAARIVLDFGLGSMMF